MLFILYCVHFQTSESQACLTFICVNNSLVRQNKNFLGEMDGCRLLVLSAVLF